MRHRHPLQDLLDQAARGVPFNPSDVEALDLPATAASRLRAAYRVILEHAEEEGPAPARFRASELGRSILADLPEHERATRHRPSPEIREIVQSMERW